MKVLNKVQKFILFAMLIVLVAIVVYVVLIFLPNKDKQASLNSDKTIKFDYKRYSRDTELYKDIFDDLEIVLNSESIDYSKYALDIAKLFIIDFYTLDNKLNNDDVGGVQYIKEDFKDNFLLNAKSTVYKYIKSNDDGKRNQELPIVNNIELVNIKEGNYEINSVSYKSYIVELKWEYEKNMDYDSSGVITVIKENDKLYIVEKS